MDGLHEIYRKSGKSRANRTIETIQQLETLANTIDPRTGAITPRQAMPFRTPLVFNWSPSSTARNCTARAGKVVMLRAYAVTAPTTGSAVITLTQATEAGGIETMATVRIPNGSQYSDGDTLDGLPFDVPAGAWLGATVTTANGASNVSISCTVEVTT